MRLHPCTVNVVQLDVRTGQIISSKSYNKTAIAFMIDESNKKCLVVGTDDKFTREYPVHGGVKMHTKFVSQGKATLTLVKRNLSLMISNVEPSALEAWIRSLASGRPPPPTSVFELPPTTAAASPPRPASAPLKRNLAPLSPSRANASSPQIVPKPPANDGPPSQPRSKGKQRRPPGCSPAWNASPAAGNARLSPSATANLTNEQADILREVVLGGKSVFFTGGAGVGKSHLMKQIVKRLDPRTTYVTASTGLAACAIGGVTIHHWAGIGGSMNRPINDIIESARRKRGAQWRSATALVIDEISMLDGDLFDLLEVMGRRIRGNDKPFGGLQLIICGDFFQLPPVAKAGTPFKFAFEASSWNRCIERTHELTKVFRQSDDSFVRALNMIRVGNAPTEVRTLLRPCEGRVLEAVDGIAATRLFTHKADCEKLNQTELKNLSGSQMTFTARDEGRDNDALTTLKSSCPAPESLTLKVGAQVILIKTVDSDAGLVNGARGVVTRFLQTRNPSIRFNNGVERTMRLEAFSLSHGGQVVASRMQLPLALSWGISVHKSQGMTLDRCELSLKNVFECGQMYVALSRARSLEGLSLRGVDWSKCRAHPKVLAWHKEQQRARLMESAGCC